MTFLPQGHDFWHVTPTSVEAMLGAMSLRQIPKEQHLLTGSGLLAIALVAWIATAHLENAGALGVTLGFALCFLGSAYGRALDAPNTLTVACIPAMLILSVAMLALARDTAALILAVVMMASAPYQLSQKHCVWLLIGSNIAYLAVLIGIGINGATTTSWASLLALQVFALTSSLARKRETLAQEELARQNSALRAARALIAQKSQAEERLRIAGDLHDSIGHGLTALRLQLAATVHQSPAHLQAELSATQDLAAELLDQLRAIVRRSTASRGSDLMTGLAELAALTPEIQIDVSPSLPSVDPDLAEQLVFCAQEAIHNAIRHGGATRIIIRETNQGLCIRDDGTGLRRGPVRPGFGLTHINSRLEQFGGRAQLRPTEREDSSRPGCELDIAFLSEDRA